MLFQCEEDKSPHDPMQAQRGARDSACPAASHRRYGELSPSHSSRSAATGSIRVARRAGR